MQSATINIFIPTYEPKREHLQAAIESVLAQTEQRWTLFIHDDASVTDVRATVEPYLHDSRITFGRSPVRLGIGGNWNACLPHGSADYIQYLFQDDLFEPSYLERALAAFTQEDIGFVVSNHRYLFEGNVPLRHSYEAVEQKRTATLKPGRNNGHEFLRFWIEQELTPNFIGEPSFVMLRRSLMEKVGPFSEDMPQFLDVEYWLRCLMNADFAFVPNEGGAFRVHPEGASARNEESGAGIYDRLRCFEKLIAMLPRGEARTAAINARARALESMARKFFARVKSGKSVRGGSARTLRTFCFRHPLLVLGAIVRALSHSK